MTRAGDWRGLALGPGGRSLIEASAGTGKTWTISVLYLRLLLEERLGPAQVVVTTFTDAAAQELRERVRARIGWALDEADRAGDGGDGGDGGDDDLRWLRARWAGGDRAGAARADAIRLRLAQAELDRAPIGTLHGLCRRILADHPFESGSPFAFAEPVAPDAIQAELVADLWRRLSQSEGALPEDDEVWRAGGRRALEKFLRLVLAPGVGVATIDPAPIAAVMREANARMLCAWLDTAKFARSNSKLCKRLIALATFIANDGVGVELPDDLADVLDEPRANHLKPPTLGSVETDRVYAFARHAASVLSLAPDLPRARALARYREDLRERGRALLAASGRMTFDELIERVARGLSGAQGAALADRLYSVWPVALVDEFQDTDLQQYAILDRVYREGEGDAAPRGRLVMIGDPKQAIYRFRGGDIDAYLEARRGAASTLELDTNFRSSPQFVRALNALYARAGAALSSDPEHPIRYVEVGASARLVETPYRVDGDDCERPLQFHYWDDGAVPEAHDERVEAALEACANHVVELLSGRHALGGEALRPGNIAVLLPTRAQVLQLRDALRERAVPCVTSAWSSVFDSPWARELRIVLYAALHPRDGAAVRAALATRLGGRTFAELRDQRDDAWQNDAELFEGYDQLWLRRGVLALVQAVAGAAGPRLIGADDGERALTDLRHLGELLQARSDEVAGREELLNWFADECERAIPEAAEAAADERQQRIESDAARVRLLTLHAAKGLEFDVVLLPLMWTNRHNFLDDVAVVTDLRARERRLTFGDEAMRRYRREGQDERYRLLYVALTRARHCCHVYALSPARRHAKRSDADPDRAPLDGMVERVLRDGAVPPDIEGVLWSAGRWRWPHARYTPARAPALLAVHVLALPRPLPFESTWSFSALLQSAAAGASEEGAAADEAAPPVADDGEATPRAETEPEHPQLAWLAPVAGADFGNAVHAVFEQREIGRPLRDQHALIERCLREQGVRLGGIPLDELTSHLAERVQASLDAPLLAGDPRLTLAGLPAHALCAELPFEFALGEVSLQRLRAACDFVPPTSLHTLRGMMTGKIDLAFEHDGRFHVLDYKSNRLGTRLSDYLGARLTQAMADGHYRFQALLYTVALERYLRQRVAGYRRDRHLGAAIYLFVRAVGIAPHEPGAGIWTQRFDGALLDAVDAALAGAAQEAA